MATYIKYYKFTDPIAKTVTKSVGWQIVRNMLEAEVQVKDGHLVPVRQLNKECCYEVKPKAKDAEEITKEEYDKLDTSEESLFYKELRGRRERDIEIYMDRFRDPYVEPSVQKYLERIDALNIDIGNKTITTDQALTSLMASK